MSLINISNLTFAYPGSSENIFENVSFQIDSSWKLGLIGRNGRDIDKLRKKPNNQKLKEQVDYWNDMHFKYRMPFENQALFGLKKL